MGIIAGLESTNDKSLQKDIPPLKYLLVEKLIFTSDHLKLSRI